MPDQQKPAVVAIIGASSGIGLATARACAARGDHLLLGSRSQKSLAAAAKSCKSLGAASVHYQVLDVTDANSVTGFFEAVSANAERLDAVVHTATTMAYGRLEELDSEIFQAVTRTAIEGTFTVARQALGIFRKQQAGTLVVVNSIVGSIAAPQLGAYVTAKWGRPACCVDAATWSRSLIRSPSAARQSGRGQHPHHHPCRPPTSPADHPNRRFR